MLSKLVFKGNTLTTILNAFLVVLHKIIVNAFNIYKFSTTRYNNNNFGTIIVVLARKMICF